MKLNLGSGPLTCEGWVNLDYAPGARLAKVPGFRALNRRVRLFRSDWPDSIFVHDLRKPFPWESGSIECIYTSHTLQHMTRVEGGRLLEECHRVLQQGGIIRVVVPDLRRVIERYLTGEIPADQFIERLRVIPEREGRLGRLRATCVECPMTCMYDSPALLRMMAACGFSCEQRNPFESAIRDIAELESLRPNVDQSVIVEGVRVDSVRA